MKKIFPFLLMSLSIVFVSCEDSEDELEATQISAQAIEDNSDFENTFSGVENVSADASIKEDDNADYDFGNCASVTIAPDWLSNTFPKTITVDFGDTNCLGRDGNYRRGKVIIELSGRYADSGTVIVSRLENYYQNDNRIEGTKTKRNIGRNANNNLVYEVNVENGSMDHVNGYSISWNSSRTTEWVSGDSTLSILDDVYSISANANGVTREGRTYTMNTTKNLEVALNCRWIKSGTISIKPAEFDERTVDYGDGNCDRLATYTVNGRDFQFTMR